MLLSYLARISLTAARSSLAPRAGMLDGLRLPLRVWPTDLDTYGHVNNATYYSWFDTALTTMAIERGVLRAPGQTSIGLCIASGCEFLAPVGFPETVDVGVRIGRIGKSSLRYELAIFSTGEAPVAVCHFTHVFFDAATRKGVALTDQQKAAIADLVL